jgi:hypothetical protein
LPGIQPQGLRFSKMIVPGHISLNQLYQTKYWAKHLSLEGKIQHYAWVAMHIPSMLQLENNEQQPFAEYWLVHIPTTLHGLRIMKKRLGTA